jgi:hypothetical protein
MDPRAGTEPAAAPTRTGYPTLDDGDSTVRSWERWAAAAGVVVVGFAVADLFSTSMPDPASATDVADQITAHIAGLRTELLLKLVSDVAFLVFLAAVWSRLRRAEGPAGTFATLFLAGGAVSEAVYLVSIGLDLAVVQYGYGSGGAGQEGLPALSVLGGWVGVATRPATIAMFLGAAAVILSTRVLPRWLGWLALAVAVLTLGTIAVHVSGYGGVVPFLVVDWATYGLSLLWTLITSIVLVRAGEGLRADR